MEPSRRWIATNWRSRVALEADEEEAGFELAEALVDAVGEGVAAAQDPLAVVERRPRRGGRGRRPGSSARRRCSASRSSGSDSSRPPSGAPLVLVAADRLLLVFQRRAVPDLEQHPDPAGDQVAAAAHPGRPLAADPDEAVHRLGVLGADVRGAVLEAHQVARRVLAAAGASRCGRSRAATSA